MFLCWYWCVFFNKWLFYSIDWHFIKELDIFNLTSSCIKSEEWLKIKLVKVQFKSTHWYVRLGQVSPKLWNVAKKKSKTDEKRNYLMVPCTSIIFPRSITIQVNISFKFWYKAFLWFLILIIEQSHFKVCFSAYSQQGCTGYTLCFRTYLRLLSELCWYGEPIPRPMYNRRSLYLSSELC